MQVHSLQIIPEETDCYKNRTAEEFTEEENNKLEELENGPQIKKVRHIGKRVPFTTQKS